MALKALDGSAKTAMLTKKTGGDSQASESVLRAVSGR